jgi:hypothetical protein
MAPDDSSKLRDQLGVPQPPRRPWVWPTVLLVGFVVALVLFYFFGLEVLVSAD